MGCTDGSRGEPEFILVGRASLVERSSGHKHPGRGSYGDTFCTHYRYAHMDQGEGFALSL